MNSGRDAFIGYIPQGSREPLDSNNILEYTMLNWPSSHLVGPQELVRSSLVARCTRGRTIEILDDGYLLF